MKATALGVLFAVAARGIFASEGAPEAVKTFFEEGKAQLESIAPTWTGRDGVGGLEFEPLFWHRAEGFKGSSAAYYIAGYQTQFYKGAIGSQIAIIDSSGKAVFQLPHEGNTEAAEKGVGTSPYTDAIIVRIDEVHSVLALSAPDRGNQRPGYITLSQLEPSEREIAVFDGGVREGNQYSRFWESMLYFYDADGDGRPDILINRRIHVMQPDTTYKYANQKVAYRLVGSQELEPQAMDLSPSELARLISKCKEEPRVPHIQQYGLPYQATDDPDFGEAIFPSEEQWRSIKFKSVQEGTVLPDRAVHPRRPESSSFVANANSALPSDVSQPVASGKRRLLSTSTFLVVLVLGFGLGLFFLRVLRRPKE